MILSSSLCMPVTSLANVPAVVIYDRDGEEDKYEYRIRIAAELAGVRYVNYD